MLDLLRPFAYLTVQHQSRLPVFMNFWLPFIATIIFLILWFAMPGAINFYGPQGLIDRLLSFIQTLAGFYIAALAAVSSFNSPHLDRVMPFPAPRVKIKYNGGLTEVELTRRRFLTLMFSYLTALSFLFSFLAIAALVLAGPISIAIPAGAVFLRWAGLVVFIFLAMQLAVVTFWGLFYLGERMLTPD